MLSWTERFAGPIIGRGKKIAEEGSVVGLHRAPEGWRALVVGTELYRTTVQIERAQMTAGWCNCPYAEKSGSCKHMAALCFLLEQYCPVVQRDDDKALEQLLDEWSTDEVDDALQFAIDCGSPRCTAVLLNRKNAAGQPQYIPDEFSLDDLPEDLPGRTPDRQGDNDPMKLLFSESAQD